MDIKKLKRDKFNRQLNGSYLFDIVKVMQNFNEKQIKNIPDFRKIFKKDRIAIIGELKKADFYDDFIDENFDIKKYAEEMAVFCDALSIVTEDEKLMGEPHFIEDTFNIVSVPIIRRDIILSPLHIFESKELGASAISFIASITGERYLKEYLKISNELKLDCIIEVSNLEELESALKCGFEIVNINFQSKQNKRLDIEKAQKIVNEIPRDIIVLCQSYFNNIEEIKILEDMNIKGAIISNMYTSEEKDSIYNKMITTNAK